jgi:hypothetical protein
MYRLLFANDFWHVLGSRAYVSGLLIDLRILALLGFASAMRILLTVSGAMAAGGLAAVLDTLFFEQEGR